MRRAGVVALSLLFLGLGSIGPAGASRGPGDGLRLVAVRHSLLGAHFWYQQTFHGHPVIGGYLGRHEDLTTHAVLAQDGRVTIRGKVASTASVSRARAERSARSAAQGTPGQASLAVLPGAPARLVWAVMMAAPRGTTRVLVDATTGRVVRVESMVKEVDGTGRVFHPNAVVTLQDQGLTDRNDADYPRIQPAYQDLTLRGLDGSGFLRGPAARIVEARGGLAFEPTNEFIYSRADDGFEQVVAYFDVTEAQIYIQSLGFTDVNNESQDLFINTIPDDNSFYDPVADSITLGRGGVDDGEDADVTWHELGHAIQDDQVPAFGIGHDAGSIGEGFGDYWAVTMSQPVNGDYLVPCVADWDATSYDPSAPHCLRRTDLDLTVSEQTGEIHHDGQIWSRALWDISQGAGREVANTIILEAQFSYAPSTSFEAAARTTVRTANQLYGREVAQVAFRAFRDRGIL